MKVLVVASHGALATADRDLCLEWWALAGDEPEVGGADRERLNIVIQSDIGEDELHLRGSKEATGAVGVY